MKKICALIVTYNRPELLCRCVEHLILQDYPLDVFIYDNHSDKDTKKKLEEKNLLKENVTYFYAKENSGGSGGFHNGMKMVMEKDYDALLLMDDDGYALYPNTLSTLVRAWETLGHSEIILNSLVICDIKTQRLSFSLNREFDANVIKQNSINGLVKDYISPFNGTLVTKEVIKKIGYPIKEFFVYGDETEYSYRAKATNIDLYTVTDSIYFHPTLTVKMRRFLWMKISISEVPLWKTYCSARNSMYYMKKYFGPLARLKKKLRIYLECLYASKNKLKKLKEAKRGIRDGLKGDFTRKLDLSK